LVIVKRPSNESERGNNTGGISFRKAVSVCRCRGESGEKPMRITVIGWGSLIWDPRGLPREGMWEKGGPVLPIEFSRVSEDCRLTLVIDDANGNECTTQYVRSPRADLDDAIRDLQLREGTGKKWIGFVDIVHGKTSCSMFPEQIDVSGQIHRWCAKTEFDAAVWTALRSNFNDEKKKAFSVNAAVDHLQDLPQTARINAFKYIQNAPARIDTPLRRRLLELGLITP